MQTKESNFNNASNLPLHEVNRTRTECAQHVDELQSDCNNNVANEAATQEADKQLAVYNLAKANDQLTDVTKQQKHCKFANSGNLHSPEIDRQCSKADLPAVNLDDQPAVQDEDAMQFDENNPLRADALLAENLDGQPAVQDEDEMQFDGSKVKGDALPAENLDGQPAVQTVAIQTDQIQRKGPPAKGLKVLQQLKQIRKK